MLVDAARLSVYGASFIGQHLQRSAGIMSTVAVAIGCAFAGALIGKQLLQKVTLRIVRLVMAATMFVVGAAVAAGLLQ